MRRARNSGALLLALALALLGVAALCLPGPALAGAPKWRIESISNTTTTSPNPSFEYTVQIVNAGDAPTSGKIELLAELPAGMVAKKASLWNQSSKSFPCFDAADGVSPVAGASAVICADEEPVPAFLSRLQRLSLVAEAEPGLAGTLVAHFGVSGGGAGEASTADQTLVSAEPPPFGIDAFDTEVLDAGGEVSTTAGAHPAANVTSFDLNTLTNPLPLKGFAYPVEPLRDVRAELPAGLVGNPGVVERCTLGQLANSQQYAAKPLCLPASQVGTVLVRVKSPAPPLGSDNTLGPLSVFNLVPPPGAPARFGFNVLGTVVVLDAQVRSGSDYGITVGAASAPQALAIVGNTIEFWGDPAAEAHDSERACPGVGAPAEGNPTAPAGCPGDYTRPEPVAFLRNPTSCTNAGEGLSTSLHADSWAQPGVYDERTSISHEAPGFPYAPEEWGPQVGIEECEAVPFEPQFSVLPSSHEADSPTGLAVEVSMPQHGLEEPEAISESDLKGAVVRLPQGMSINPSAASGQGACDTAQVGYIPNTSAPYEFTPAPAQCPDSSKVGNLEIETPLIDHPLKGAVFLAKQSENPFGSLLALYLVVEDEQSGVTIKLAGRVVIDEETGRLETVFDENPQAPFTHLQVNLFGGPRAALRTPATCGTYAAEASFTPWSGTAPVQEESSFKITAGPGGAPCPSGAFNPRLSAGTQNPIAAQTSPFVLRLSREDGEGELGGLQATLPPGLSGYLTGIAYCSDAALAAVSGELGTGAAQEQSPSCPASSLVGTVTAGAGAGSNPFYTTAGRAYLAGPYKGAPLSLAVIAPAVAGPFDLGSVVVRNALRVDPETARITAVSDPFPTALHGIPLDLRSVEVLMNRSHFTLNPTSCDPMSVDSTIASTAGATASPSTRFQVSGCESLPFKPKLSLSLKGKTRRGSFPALKAVLSMPPGSANIASARVTLSHAMFIANAHIGSPCTRVQFAANVCPPSSVLGKAKAETPLLDAPLEGPIYLMSGFGHLLPDLALDLGGQIHVFAHGKVDTGKGGGIRNTFEVVPDAPVSKITLELLGKKKGLLELSENICAKPQHALAEFSAHNGKISDTEPLIRAKCPKKAARHKRHHARAGR